MTPRASDEATKKKVVRHTARQLFPIEHESSGSCAFLTKFQKRMHSSSTLAGADRPSSHSDYKDRSSFIVHFMTGIVARSANLQID